MRVGAALNLLSCLGMTEENWVRRATSKDILLSHHGAQELLISGPLVRHLTRYHAATLTLCCYEGVERQGQVKECSSLIHANDRQGLRI
jgi:hypothetical protein